MSKLSREVTFTHAQGTIKTISDRDEISTIFSSSGVNAAGHPSSTTTSSSSSSNTFYNGVLVASSHTETPEVTTTGAAPQVDDHQG